MPSLQGSWPIGFFTRMLYTTHYASPIGLFTLCSNGESLAGLWIESQKYFMASLSERPTKDDSLQAFRPVKEWLDAYFAGEQPRPDGLDLEPQGTPFRQHVWQNLLQIPYGHTVTYGQLSAQVARQMGLPHMSAQAVGGAVGHNPISIIIPCHRVVGADGSLTGYAGGIERKRWLLEWERRGVSLTGPDF